MFASKLHPNTKTAWRIVFVTLLTVTALSSLFYFAPTADSSRIAFASFDGNDFEIYTVNADGSDLLQLTDNDINDWGATWSPDHTQIAYRSGTPYASAIYVMDADGTHSQQLTPPQLQVGSPYYHGTMTWSPDGTRIAFSADFNGNWDIWTLRLNDGMLTRLTSTMGEDLHPDWSPDGDTIVFNRYDQGLLEIVKMDINTGHITQLTDNSGGMVMYPRWSPDGDTIAFFVNLGDSADVFLMDANGRNMRQITTDSAIDRVAVFSPDGQSLVFRSERDGNSNIYTINLRTGRTNAVTTNVMMDMAPDW